MDMCGNQNPKRSIMIICTLEQHEADRCGMPVGKSVLLGKLRMTYCAAFFVEADMSITVLSNLHHFVFLKQGCKALLSGWRTQALFGVQRSTLLIVTML